MSSNRLLLGIACLLLLVTAAQVQVLAQAPKIARGYVALGAPSDPKVSVHWNRYHDFAQSTEIMKQLAEKFPKFCKMKSLGKSYGGRDMWVLTLTNFATGDDAKKPAFWIDGGIHANEIQCTEVVLYTAWYLLESYETNPLVKRLLDTQAFYIVPMMSPDSRDAHFYKPNTTHSPRSGQIPVDNDLDGRVNEDGYDDLDGDGSITQMRVKDSNGKFKKHLEYPELLVRVKPGEKGEYTLLGGEGIDNDGDGMVNEDGDGYYDPNRDWGWLWESRRKQWGAHKYPFSIPENRMVADFIIDHPNISGAITYHNTGGMFLRPPGAKTDALEPQDVQVMDVLGKMGEQILPGYKYMVSGAELYETYGGESDWLAQMRGMYAFTVELNTPFNWFRKEAGGGFIGEDEDMFKFDKLVLLGEAMAPWREVNHPTYGKIEVGGLKKSGFRQPPSFMLEDECHRNMAFSLQMADQLPQARVQSVSVKPLDGGVYQVTAIIENNKLMPTRSFATQKHKITPPDLVTIEGKDVKVLAALTSKEQFFAKATNQKQTPEKVKLSNIDGHGVVYVRWLVSGKGPYTVKLQTLRGGSDVKTTK